MGKSKVETKSPRKKLLPITKSIARIRSTSNTLSAVPGANIRVVVRVRPPNEKEEHDNYRNVIRLVDDKLLIFDPQEDAEPFFYHGVAQKGRDLSKRANKNLQFLFDRVFGWEATNADVFNHSTQDLIKALMDGCNCSVFVYGATGAGKTHTMLGHNQNPGITFLTMNELFKRKEELTSERDFELAVTYLEVYNENVQDLLNPGVPLHLREDGQYGVRVQGIQITRIEQPFELFDLLEKGNKNRTQHPTDANAESSRSHAVFQVYLRMKIKSTDQIRIAKLSMIDLAGSERGAATGCMGARFTEGANINKSLLALGNCINGLADGLRHIPYRDSKLTRLLKDSLGGNCQTVMIANISPSSLCYEDTYNTLKYANRAKKIKSSVKKNVVNCEGHVSQYIKKIEELTKKIDELENAKNNTNDEPKVSLNADQEKEFKSKYEDYKKIQEQLLEQQALLYILELKSQAKLDANAQLNKICTDTPDREKGNRKLDIGVERLNSESENIQQKIQLLYARKSEIKQQIDSLLEATPELTSYSKDMTAKLAHLEAQYKVDLLQKVESLYKKELEVRSNIFDKMAEVLQPCYLLLRGLNAAPEDLIKDYKTLVRYLQGIGSVSFSDNTKISTPTNTTIDNNIDEENRPTKRKHTDEINTMDKTYVLKTSKHKYLTASDYLSKVNLTPQPAKKIAKVTSASPHFSKENRRQVGTMGTAQRFPLVAESKFRKLSKSLSKSAVSILQRPKV